MEDELDLMIEMGANTATSEQVLTLYIPSTDCKGQVIDNQEYWVQEASGICCLIGGGVTVHPGARGGWLSPDNEIIWDDPVILYTFAIPERFIQNLPKLRKFLHRMGKETNQGEVAFSFDGMFYRIDKYDEGASV